MRTGHYIDCEPVHIHILGSGVLKGGGGGGGSGGRGGGHTR